MTDTNILKLLRSKCIQDMILGMNILAVKSLEEVTEFFKNYSEYKVRDYDYLLYPNLIRDMVYFPGVHYITNTDYIVVRCSDTLQLCKTENLLDYLPKWIEL